MIIRRVPQARQLSSYLRNIHLFVNDKLSHDIRSVGYAQLRVLGQMLNQMSGMINEHLTNCGIDTEVTSEDIAIWQNSIDFSSTEDFIAGSWMLTGRPMQPLGNTIQYEPKLIKQQREMFTSDQVADLICQLLQKLSGGGGIDFSKGDDSDKPVATQVLGTPFINDYRDLKNAAAPVIKDSVNPDEIPKEKPKAKPKAKKKPAEEKPKEEKKPDNSPEAIMKDSGASTEPVAGNVRHFVPAMPPKDYKKVNSTAWAIIHKRICSIDLDSVPRYSTRAYIKFLQYWYKNKVEVYSKVMMHHYGSMRQAQRLYAQDYPKVFAAILAYMMSGDQDVASVNQHMNVLYNSVDLTGCETWRFYVPAEVSAYMFNGKDDFAVPELWALLEWRYLFENYLSPINNEIRMKLHGYDYRPFLFYEDDIRLLSEESERSDLVLPAHLLAEEQLRPEPVSWKDWWFKQNPVVNPRLSPAT